VPGPSDVVLVPLGLADPRRAFALAAAATLGATVGGLVAYFIGAELFDTVGQWVLTRFGVSNEVWEARRALFEERGWMIVILSTMSPLSTKFVCIAAGAFGVPLGEFALALLVGRATRFTAIAAIVRFAGERFRAYLGRKLGAENGEPRRTTDE
jgi:membrane protein YqaA with SNARE-associated domain